MSDQRRPSASLRTRRPSTVYNEVDEQGQGQVPPVPEVGDNHLTQYFQQPQHQQQQRRPSAQHADSHESSGSGRQRGGPRDRDRGERVDRGAGTGAAGDAGDSSKVGARLLNKRQSVSFGKAMAANARAGVRGGGGGGGGPIDDGYGGQVPPPPMPVPSSSSSSRGYADANGRAPAPQGMVLAPGGGRRGAATEASAGEEMVHLGPRGPTGQPLSDLLREDFTADNCAYRNADGMVRRVKHTPDTPSPRQSSALTSRRALQQTKPVSSKTSASSRQP